MIKKNMVSLWLGKFDSSYEFDEYVDMKFDEDGNYINSNFQKEFSILSYDLDSIEKDWIDNTCNSVEELLYGFSYDEIIIRKFKDVIKCKDLSKYNSILLLYNYEYEEKYLKTKLMMDYIGCVDINCFI